MSGGPTPRGPTTAAGLADRVAVELAGRAIQGAGSALIAPAALTVLFTILGATPGEPVERRWPSTALPPRRGHRRCLLGASPAHAETMTRQLIDLSHPIVPGMFTHPGLPGPEWEPFRTREEYRAATGTTFQIDRVTMVGNTGTYLDSPFHRFAEGGDLASLPLSAVADLRVLVVDARGHRAVDASLLAALGDTTDIGGAAVLLHTGGDRAWGTADYAADAPFLTGEGADWLAERRPAVVGLDAVNIDDLADPSRPAHTRLLGDGILVLEHLTGLDALPPRGARLHAAPLPWHGVGTFPVRAYAVVDDGGR